MCLIVEIETPEIKKRGMCKSYPIPSSDRGSRTCNNTNICSHETHLVLPTVKKTNK
jgi:hypothetical protein